MFHPFVLECIRQICLQLNKIHSFVSQKKKKKTKVQMRVYFEILNVYTFQWNKFHFEIQYGAKAMGKISPTLILSKPKLRYLSVISSLDSTQFYNE